MLRLPGPHPLRVARSQNSIPLVRYVGEWIYPTVGAHFHGLQPESAELVGAEESGQASGTLTARFRLPPGAATIPWCGWNLAARLDTPAQKFALVTADGATGRMELIPGPAFNLLEVNFSVESRPGTVSQGNFLLIKK